MRHPLPVPWAMKNGRHSCKRIGVTVEGLAERLGLNRSSVSCVIQGARRAPPGFASRVADAVLPPTLR